MRATVTLAFISLLAVLGAADIALAQFAGPWAQAFQEGHSRGTRAGQEDSRRGQSFNFSDEADWRRADAGYRSQYGPVERYRAEFRRGYEQGYRSGYETYGRGRGRGGYGSGRYDPPPYGRGRGRGPGGGYGDDYRYGYGNRRAFDMGYTDGYEAGLDDGRDRRRFDPIAEGRYRSGDRGYEREYGSRESYKIEYRQAFKQGYQAGYEDGRRYGTRRWWNPFGR